MKRALATALAAGLCLAPMAFQAARADPAYVPLKNALGQPDLSGYWTNASLTPESRPGALGDRLVYTPAEVAKQEGDATKLAAAANKPTDPKASATATDKLPDGVALRPEFAAAGGNVGGYNYGWLDPGTVVMRVHGEPRTSLITTTNGRAPAFKAGFTPPKYDVRMFTNFDNPETRSLGERCILSFGRNAGPPMLANGFYNNDYEIVQSKDTIAINVEMVHDVRLIHMTGGHRTDGLRPYMGDSIGHWEGNTLVVETTNIPQAQAYHGAWKELTVTEKFTRVAKNRLLYQFTVSDPTVWDTAWGGEYEFAPMNGIVYEYACHEGNYALEDMLAGARADDAKALAQANTAPVSAVVAPGAPAGAGTPAKK